MRFVIPWVPGSRFARPGMTKYFRAYAPVNFGARFSVKAATPSL